VVQRNGGSGCLRDMGLVTRIIREVSKVISIPLTVKTRSGWNDESRNPIGIALAMQDAGAQAFTLHARTRTQMFTGSANWDEIAMVKEALSVPVIGNGDIETADDILRMKQHTDCDAIMVGRGSFGNPWLFREGRALLDGKPRPAAPTLEERFAVALSHARLALELQGDTKHTVVEFRKHFGWYTRGLPYGNELRQKLFAVESMTEAEAIFVRYVEERQLHVAGAA